MRPEERYDSNCILDQLSSAFYEAAVFLLIRRERQLSGSASPFMGDAAILIDSMFARSAALAVRKLWGELHDDRMERETNSLSAMLDWTEQSSSRILLVNLDQAITDHFQKPFPGSPYINMIQEKTLAEHTEAARRMCTPEGVLDPVVFAAIRECGSTKCRAFIAHANKNVAHAASNNSRATLELQDIFIDDYIQILLYSMKTYASIQTFLALDGITANIPRHTSPSIRGSSGNDNPTLRSLWWAFWIEADKANQPDIEFICNPKIPPFHEQQIITESPGTPST